MHTNKDQFPAEITNTVQVDSATEDEAVRVAAEVPPAVAVVVHVEDEVVGLVPKAARRLDSWVSSIKRAMANNPPQRS